MEVVKGAAHFFHNGFEGFGFHGGCGAGELVFGVVASFGGDEMVEHLAVGEHADAGLDDLVERLEIEV